MKVQGGVTQTQTIEGTISMEELLALVRETIHVPPGAHARFYATGHSLTYQMNIHGQQCGALADITAESPLKFRITWELPVAEKQG